MLLVMFKLVLLLCVLMLINKNEAARILAYYPMPSISHQVVFRPLTMELTKRGHEVVVITTDPIFPKGDGPINLKEIDVHDVSYTLLENMREKMGNNFNRNNMDFLTKMELVLFETQVNTNDVKKLLEAKAEFDLVIVEEIVEVTLSFSYYFNAPVIQFSSLGGLTITFKNFGANTHPFVYPTPLHERVYNLTICEKLNELYFEYNLAQIAPNNMELINKMLKRLFGSSIPSFEELSANVDMLFLNVHSLWDFNRPVPLNVIYLGNLHQIQQKELPADLKTYLDSSKNGVIYVSFGSNVDPGLFPPAIIQTLVNVFSKLPCDVLWKWNQDELPDRTPNIRISKWLPQSDLLRHPKVKLFVTQGGLQSTDEAITAGVPLIGIPIFGDQRFNVEQYLHFQIGERVELETITEEKLSNALHKVLKDNIRYRRNVEKLRSIMNDQPQSPLERAVWWTEYVIRHKGAKHLRSPAANMSLAEYLELKLIVYVVIGLLLAFSLVVYFIYFLYSALSKRGEKLKMN